MRCKPGLAAAFLTLLALPASAQEKGLARPDLVLQQVVEGLPREERQSVRVLTATFNPGDKTVHHTHRFPVTVYVLEGAFRLELKGREPLTVKAGEAMVEPPNRLGASGNNPIPWVRWLLVDDSPAANEHTGEG